MRTSFSLHFLESIPTNNLRSSAKNKNKRTFISEVGGVWVFIAQTIPFFTICWLHLDWMLHLKIIKLCNLDAFH